MAASPLGPWVVPSGFEDVMCWALEESEDSVPDPHAVVAATAAMMAQHQTARTIVQIGIDDLPDAIQQTLTLAHRSD